MDPSSASLLFVKILKGAAALTNSSLERCSVETFPDGHLWEASSGLPWRARVWTPARWIQAFGSDPENAWQRLYAGLLAEYTATAPQRAQSSSLGLEAFGSP